MCSCKHVIASKFTEGKRKTYRKGKKKKEGKKIKKKCVATNINGRKVVDIEGERKIYRRRKKKKKGK